MRNFVTYRLAGTVLLMFLACAAVFLAANGCIGVPRFRLEEDLRSSQHIPDNWTVTGDVTDKAAVYLFYPPEQNTYGVSVYINRPGPSFSYFFRGSYSVADIHGTIQGLSNEVDVIPLEVTGLFAYVSMNLAGIERIESNDSVNMEQISLDSQAPFALLLPQSADSLTFFNENECPVEIRCHPL